MKNGLLLFTVFVVSLVSSCKGRVAGPANVTCGRTGQCIGGL